jgi:hypothetical protein
VEEPGPDPPKGGSGGGLWTRRSHHLPSIIAVLRRRNSTLLSISPVRNSDPSLPLESRRRREDRERRPTSRVAHTLYQTQHGAASIDGGEPLDDFLPTGELTLSTLSRAAIASRAAVLRSERARAGAITSRLRNTAGRSFSALSKSGSSFRHCSMKSA